MTDHTCSRHCRWPDEEHKPCDKSAWPEVSDVPELEEYAKGQLGYKTRQIEPEKEKAIRQHQGHYNYDSTRVKK